MNICIISKYPPIQGGVSASTFWLARGLAEREHQVHVVTNANCVEKEYFIDDKISEISPNLFIHSVIPDIPWHIPYSELYIPRLLDKVLEVIDKYQIDIIDTYYLIPYGIVGYLASKIKGIPYIIRHGGSDIEKFLRKGTFKHLLRNVIQNAAVVLTDNKNKEFFKETNPNVHVQPRYIPDERYFNPSFVSHKLPTFAYIGKINHYWRYKSLDKIVNIFSGIQKEYKLLFVSQGKGIKDFSGFVKTRGLTTYELRDFVHPINMTDLLKNIDFLLYFNQDNPIRDFSNIVCEALWSGIPLITDKTNDVREYTNYIDIASSDQIINIVLDDIETVQGKIIAIINNWSGSARYTNKITYNYDRYLNVNLKIYDHL
jgi:glycosyltransferase involved in cell wall biosynthesis